MNVLWYLYQALNPIIIASHDLYIIYCKALITTNLAVVSTNLLFYIRVWAKRIHTTRSHLDINIHKTGAMKSFELTQRIFMRLNFIPCSSKWYITAYIQVIILLMRAAIKSRIYAHKDQTPMAHFQHGLTLIWAWIQVVIRAVKCQMLFRIPP